jgi:hypothetical protein
MNEALVPAIGDIWQEVDPRFTRFVRVVAVNTDAVALRRCTEQGLFEGFRVTRANLKRFNGKRGGYQLHRLSLTAKT